MKNDKNFKIKLVLLWVFAFSVMIFIMSMSANAEEPYFPMHQNQNNMFDSTITDAIDTYFDSENNYIFVANPSVYSWGISCNVLVVPKSSESVPYGEIYNNGYQFSIYNIGSGSYSTFCYIYSNGSVEPYGSDFGVYQGLYSSLYSNNVDYVSNFKLWSSNNESTRTLVLNYDDGTSDPINIGVAVIPPSAFIPEYLTGDTPPQNVPPEYIVTDYTWTTAPQFDGSTVINGIQSIKNTLDWLSSNLHEELANLIDNIKGLATYIGKTIQYYGNAIIETINNAIQNFYDNMKALVEPIYTTLENLYNGFLEFADLFIHPFDEEEFEDQIENCQLISQYNELMDNADDMRAIFNNAEERDYFVLYIDFENPFADSEHKIIHSEISFTWLKDYRSIYRPFLWLFTMIECFVGGMRLLGGIIGGKAK